MNDDAFDQFVDDCYDELEVKQKHLESTFGLGHFDRYDLDPDNETIIFSSDDGNSVSANFVPVGTFATQTNSWMWAWHNSAFSQSSRDKALAIQELADTTGYEIFEKPTAEVNEVMAWELSAMSLKMLNGQGVYAAPANDLVYFYALFNVGE